MIAGPVYKLYRQWGRPIAAIGVAKGDTRTIRNVHTRTQRIVHTRTRKQ